MVIDTETHRRGRKLGNRDARVREGIDLQAWLDEIERALPAAREYARRLTAYIDSHNNEAA